MGGAMRVKIHRGTHKIGGTICEIKTAQACIIIDVGLDLPSVDRLEIDAFEVEGVTKGEPNCDAVLVTHYHGDHVGMFEKVLPEVPIYMGDTAKQIFLRLQEVLKEKVDKGNPILVNKFKTFVAGKSFLIKDIKITPLCVDHSAFDAYAFLIEAEGKRILHTGDFRMHGAKGRKMLPMLEKYANNIDLLICEGSMLSRATEKVMTEYEVGAKAEELMRQQKNIFVLASSTNIDRIAMFYNAAVRLKKPFIVCDQYQSDILKIIAQNSRSSFYNFTRIKPYVYGKNLHKFMRDEGFCFMARINSVSKQAINAFADNLLIYSMWGGYLEKRRGCFDKRTFDFIEYAKVAGGEFELLHTSGHATIEDIIGLCKVTKPKKIIPIHSEKPENFETLGIDSQ